MPADLVGREAMYGGFTGLPPLGWIVLNINFRPQLAEANGNFKILQDSPSCITEVKRLQLLIAFCFGAFFEGAAGFGTALAVTARSPIGPGFLPLVSPSCGYELANLGACRALGRACVEAGNGLSLGLPLVRKKCWTNFPAWPIFSNGSTKPDQANTVRAEID